MGASPSARPLQLGTLTAALAALLFGVSTPFVRHFGEHVGAFVVASLLYVGSALAGAIPGGVPGAPLRRESSGRVVVVALCGAVIAPVCLAWGLHRTSSTTASLLLASEGPFTMLLAHFVHREAVGLRALLGLASIGAAAVVLVVSGGALHAPSGVGSLAVVVACLAWAADNVLSRPLADLDVRQVVRWKSALGAFLSLGLALATREAWPTALGAACLVVTGAFGYGVSLRLYLRAQSQAGAARTASVFACAPFAGALAGFLAGDGGLGVGTAVAGALIALGLVLHASERHGHGHHHAALDHEHAHRHDDGHHAHTHDPPFVGEHSHPHHHDADWHEHPHGPDLHHQHDHH